MAFNKLRRRFASATGIRPIHVAQADRKRKLWETNWDVESERPDSELATTVPSELKASVADGWLPPGSRVMDIGSGRGQITAWLAEQGFSVLGADLAGSATVLARKHYGHLAPAAEFKTVDMAMDTPEGEPFDALVDRGCLHCLPDELVDRYAENVAAYARPGAPFLLLHKVEDADGPGLEQRIRALFEGTFVVERVAPTIEPMQRSAGPLPRVVKPGMAFWMRRTERTTPAR